MPPSSSRLHAQKAWLRLQVDAAPGKGRAASIAAARAVASNAGLIEAALRAAPQSSTVKRDWFLVEGVKARNAKQRGSFTVTIEAALSGPYLTAAAAARLRDARAPLNIHLANLVLQAFQGIVLDTLVDQGQPPWVGEACSVVLSPLLAPRTAR